MSRKKILIPLAKRHTHHRTLALVQRSESVTSEGVDKAFWVDAVVLVLGRARKRFKPSSRRWICPSLPDVAASRAEHLFESEALSNRWRRSGGSQDGPGTKRLRFQKPRSLEESLIAARFPTG